MPSSWTAKFFLPELTPQHDQIFIELIDERSAERERNAEAALFAYSAIEFFEIERISSDEETKPFDCQYECKNRTFPIHCNVLLGVESLVVLWNKIDRIDGALFQKKTITKSLEWTIHYFFPSH